MGKVLKKVNLNTSFLYANQYEILTKDEGIYLIHNSENDGTQVEPSSKMASQQLINGINKESEKNKGRNVGPKDHTKGDQIVKNMSGSSRVESTRKYVTPILSPLSLMATDKANGVITTQHRVRNSHGGKNP